ncbi:CBS domain-containing protein [Amphibacillus jilinensis]|uniref:CBS domain-containing protein n=1 Tax=Amphibacillus jilinensis TaxID=1216008 RepID=UPI0002DA7B4F|nr:CBS domain-containing protein [Amphibacillus jilinensis]
MKTVNEVMSNHVMSCQPNQPINEIAKLMADQDIGAIPVCDENHHLLGVVTDRDLVIRGYAKAVDPNESIEQCMTRDAITCDPNQTVREAGELMAKHQIRRLPIVKDRKLIGIVSLGDLALEKQSDHMAGEALEEISEHTHYH